MIRAHLSPRPTPLIAVVGASISCMPGPALGPFVADHDDVARLDLAEDDAVVGVDLALEDHRRPGVLEHLGADPGRLDDRALGGEVARRASTGRRSAE